MNFGKPAAKSDGAELRRWDERTAPEMFWLSILSLLLLAGVFHFIDHPEQVAIVSGCLLGFVGLYPAYWVDCYWATRLQSRDRGYHWVYALFPPLRLAAHDHETNQRIWLPYLGWQRVGYELERKIQTALRIPMVIMALLVLPLLLTEYVFAQRVAEDELFADLTAAASGLIWSAFTAEFIVMAAISRSKLDYCKEHFLEVLIILLPIFGFLATMQLGHHLRLNQVTKAANLYRLRGVALRTWQSVVTFECIARLFGGSPERRIETLRIRLEKKQDEVHYLEQEIRRIESLSRRFRLHTQQVVPEVPADPPAVVQALTLIKEEEALSADAGPPTDNAPQQITPPAEGSGDTKAA
ncbi:hypothetical protein [Schlesneria sp. DSM 10557]|uniref:hypothetical protein n=1 Tax=Schlesneria sp. DSM 10557 TaxID=3044399 RepID=UPI0035A08628